MKMLQHIEIVDELAEPNTCADEMLISMAENENNVEFIRWNRQFRTVVERNIMLCLLCLLCFCPLIELTVCERIAKITGGEMGFYRSTILEFKGDMEGRRFMCLSNTPHIFNDLVSITLQPNIYVA